ACLKRFFNRLTDWGYLGAGMNPARGVKPLREPPGRMKFLSPEQARILLDACPPHIKLLVLLLMMSGMRLGEAIRLLWDDIDFERNVIIVRDSKIGERREVPMTDTLRDALSRADRRCDHVFCTPAGKPYACTRSIWETFKRATRKAGIDDLRLHDLRHHFASSLRMKGADLLDIMEYLGHKSLEMVRRYAHVTTQRKQEVIKLLNGDIRATSEPEVVQLDKAR
ncbi:MAG: site-specific integrase, partial [Pseudomonadota bacterium]